VYRAPNLIEKNPHDPAVHNWIINNNYPGVTAPLDLEGRWWALILGGSIDSPETVDPEAYLQGMIGTEFDIEILSTTHWNPLMLAVDNARVGRVFLAGDAAHLNPPYGGHGYNTGVGDGVDIGWKLAANIQGWGGSRLLDSYEPERLPVSKNMIKESSELMQYSPADLADDQLSTPGEAGEKARKEAAERIYETKRKQFNSLGIEIGYQYNDSPIIASNDSALPRVTAEYYPTTTPGARLPHIWLDDSQDYSLYDMLGLGLSVIRLNPDIDIRSLVLEAENRGIPLETIDISAGLKDRYEADLILVRPDQHVAWRGSDCPERPGVILDHVCGEI
jgi:hypothetical protein